VPKTAHKPLYDAAGRNGTAAGAFFTGTTGNSRITTRQNGGLNMADKTGLGVVGFLFGSITLAVTVIAFLVVRDHLDGRLQLESAAMAPQLVSISTSTH
jgi:hypothetical protein